MVQSLEDQLRSVYALVDELHDVTERLRLATDQTLETLKGDESS